MNGWSGFYGTKEPYALCLVNADGACLALDTEGRDISVTDLLEKVPELREVLTDSVDPGFAGTSGDDSVSKS